MKWLIQDKDPHILFIRESNIWRSHDKEHVEIEGYSLHTKKMIRCPDRRVSRRVAYIKDGIVTWSRDDLEIEDFCSIWMEVGLPREKKFLLCGVYHEWAHLKLHGKTDDSHGNKKHQEERWSIP